MLGSYVFFLPGRVNGGANRISALWRLTYIRTNEGPKPPRCATCVVHRG